MLSRDHRVNILTQAKVTHFRLGKGTITLLVYRDRSLDVTYFGTSFCSPLDRFNPVEGENKAKEQLSHYLRSKELVPDHYSGETHGSLTPKKLLDKMIFRLCEHCQDPQWVVKALRQGEVPMRRLRKSERKRLEQRELLKTQGGNGSSLTACSTSDKETDNAEASTPPTPCAKTLFTF